MIAQALAVIVRPSVCSSVRPFVRLSQAGTVPKRLNVGSRKQRHVIAQSLVNDALPLKFALKVTHPLSNTMMSTYIRS